MFQTHLLIMTFKHLLSAPLQFLDAYMCCDYPHWDNACHPAQIKHWQFSLLKLVVLPVLNRVNGDLFINNF